MTECAPAIALARLGHYKQRSCGEIVERMQARINSEDPQNTVGELLVKGDNTFIGYYKNPEADREVFTSDGWFRTGDLGYMDEDKYIFLNEVNALNDRRTTYQKRYYYEDIPSSEIAKNDKLIHNDGY